MPVFEYRCGGCGAVAEVLAKNAAEDRPPVACIRCGKDAAFTKLFSAFAVAGPTEGGEFPPECCGGGGGHQCMGGGCGCGGAD